MFGFEIVDRLKLDTNYYQLKLLERDPNDFSFGQPVNIASSDKDRPIAPCRHPIAPFPKDDRAQFAKIPTWGRACGN